MIELIGGDCFQKAQFIHDRCQMRHVFTDPGAALTMLCKFCLRTQHLGHTADERKTFSFQQGFRTILPVHSHQLGFVIKKVQVWRAAGHVKIDDSLDLRLVMGFSGRERIQRLAIDEVLEQLGAGDPGRFVTGRTRQAGESRLQDKQLRILAQVVFDQVFENIEDLRGDGNRTPTPRSLERL